MGGGGGGAEVGEAARPHVLGVEGSQRFVGVEGEQLQQGRVEQGDEGGVGGRGERGER